jgi:hypothetical protein
MSYNKLEINDYVYDSDMEVYGKVKNNQDIHNIIVEYEEYGGGLYCMDPNCEEFDPNLKLIKRK